jgi:exopolysaccharide biosynthesis polyprenyl glycosylphosphotransferase
VAAGAAAAPSADARAQASRGAARLGHPEVREGSRERPLRAIPAAPQTQAAGAIAPLLDGRRWSALCRLLDLVFLSAAAAVAVVGVRPLESAGSCPWLAVAFPFLALSAIHVRRAPQERLKGSLLDTTAKMLTDVSLAALLTLAADTVLGGSHAVMLTVRLWLFCAIGLGIERAILSAVRSHALRIPAYAKPTLIIGAGMVGDHLVRRLTSDPGYGLRPVGFLDSDPLPRDREAAPTIPVLGGPEDLAESIRATGARHVILAFSNEPDHILLARVRECERLGVTVSLVPRMFESINRRTSLDHVGGVPLLTLRQVSPRGWQFAVKHAFDRAFAVCALAALAPIMAVVALLVALSTGRPILFRQRRVGRNGHTFDLLKFRTMREPSPDQRRFELPAGVAPGGVEGEDRCTPVGRWLRALSLDELPQFINVLRGDMSVVGPRPERPEFVERFTRDIHRYEDRHRVRSGITGWAQVNGLRGQTSIADRVEWDNYYIQNWSLSLDLRILVLTVREVTRATLRDLWRYSADAEKKSGTPSAAG